VIQETLEWLYAASKSVRVLGILFVGIPGLILFGTGFWRRKRAKDNDDERG
jgi:hypothetical protein